MSYDKGDLVRCTAVFTNAAGTATDPGAVFLKVKDPSGNTTIYTYGTDAELLKDSTGNYHIDVDANQSGRWQYRFWSSGSGQAAARGDFIVLGEFDR